MKILKIQEENQWRDACRESDMAREADMARGADTGTCTKMSAKWYVESH
jgi:hypothetical protein